MTDETIQTIDETGTALTEPTEPTEQVSQLPAVGPATPMGMLSMAVARGASIEELEKLMDLQKRWEDNDARKAYGVAMSAFKVEAPEIIKDNHVSFTTTKGTTEYNHASLGNVTGKISASLGKHGLSHRWGIKQFDGGMIEVTCTVTHNLGHSESVSMSSGADDSGGKNNIQAKASTVSYLERYTLLAITGLSTNEQDNDGATVYEFITEEQVMDLEALIEDVGADKEKFLEYGMVPNLAAIHADDFKNAVAKLEAKRAG